MRADGYKDFHKDFTVKDELVAVRVDAEMEKLPGAVRMDQGSYSRISYDIPQASDWSG